MEQVYQETSPQRRWFYSMSNVLSALPKSLPSKAKADSKAISVAPTRKGAEAPFKRIVKRYGSKYPKATEKLLKDRDALLAFYTFAAEHWVHPRTTNPVESTFATAHYLTRRTKTCVTRSTFLGLAFKLAGTANEDGIPVNDDPPEERPGSTRAKRESAGHTPELTIASEFALRDPRKSLAPMKGT